MEEKTEVHVNQSALLKQIADKAITSFMLSLIPEEKDRKVVTAAISVHRKYGIDAATSIKIMTELAEVIKEENK